MLTLDTLSLPLQQRLRAVMLPSETLLWAGQPDAARQAGAGFIAWIVFLPLAVYALYSMLVSAQSGSNSEIDVVDLLTNLFLLMVGLIGMGTPILMHRSASWTYYAVTSNRAITIAGRGSYTVMSFSSSALQSVTCSASEDGVGDLLFRIDEHEDSEGSTVRNHRGFFTIPDVRVVESMLAALARQPDAGPFPIQETRQAPRAGK
jgi:hypothetical protein